MNYHYFQATLNNYQMGAVLRRIDRLVIEQTRIDSHHVVITWRIDYDSSDDRSALQHIRHVLVSPSRFREIDAQIFLSTKENT